MRNLEGDSIENQQEIILSSEDIFLVSYPKSGNTWMRFLIGNYLTGNQCDFCNSHLIIPDIHYNPERISQLRTPRFIKSHHPFNPSFKRVIYTARDGRDVAVSYYFYALKFKLIDKETSFEQFVLEIFDQSKIDNFTPWSNHIHTWLDNPPQKFKLFTYEEMLGDTARILREVLEFAGMEIDEEKVIQAVEASKFEQMRKAEVLQNEQFEPFKNSDPSIQFVRNGKAGDWRNFFTQELLAEFLKTHGSALARLNYIN
ncbi:MAG: sulfotransferase domain-containing protein [Leptolyngbyaceae cyanobacterium SL_7_1]|nr:sulfotransferase domain-containing protein [Leptolyngbyaceae cyanobacterium SL_7_1]